MVKQRQITWLFKPRERTYPTTLSRVPQQAIEFNSKNSPKIVDPNPENPTGKFAVGWEVKVGHMERFLKDLEEKTKHLTAWRKYSVQHGMDANNLVLLNIHLKETKKFEDRYKEIMKQLIFWETCPTPGGPAIPFFNAAYFHSEESKPYFWEFVKLINEEFNNVAANLRGRPEGSVVTKEQRRKCLKLRRSGYSYLAIAKKVFPSECVDGQMPGYLKQSIYRLLKPGNKK